MKEYKFKIHGNEYEVSINSVEDNIADVTVNGTQYEVEIEGKASKVSKITKPTPSTSSAATAAAKKSAGTAVKSPLPGVIVDLKVREGDQVKAGQHLLVLEAMKMENNIDADRDGIIVELKVNKGDSVLEGDTLLTIG